MKTSLRDRHCEEGTTEAISYFDRRSAGFESRDCRVRPHSAGVLAITALGLLILAGCGFYSFTGAIPPHIETINIPLFVNETAEFGIAEAVTDEVTNVFIEENILRVRRSETSDSELRGTIREVTDTPYTYSGAEEVINYRLTIRVEVEWFDVAREETLLKKNYDGWGTYSLTQDYSSDGIDNDDDGLVDAEDPDEIGDPRNLAAKVAVGKIATDIISDIVSTW